MATTSFRTRTTQQQPPPPSSRQWFRLSTLPVGNSNTASAATTTSSRPPTPQDQKQPSGQVMPLGLPNETGRSAPPVTSPKISNPKISLVTLSPPPATTTSSPLSSLSPSIRSPFPGLANAAKEAKADTTPLPPITPVPKPTSESIVTMSLPTPKPSKINNEPQAPYSSPLKVHSSASSPPRQQPILPDKSNGHHKHFTAAAVSVDEEKTKFISLAGQNRGVVFVDVVASPNKHRSSKISSSDRERGHPGYSKNEHPANLGGLGAFTNSNVQGVNNSLLFNSSFLHHDPGVHIITSTTN